MRTTAPRTTPRWATRKEAAFYARVSVDTLDRWIRDGHITRYGAGRGIRINLVEVDAHLMANASGKRAAS